MPRAGKVPVVQAQGIAPDRKANILQMTAEKEVRLSVEISKLRQKITQSFISDLFQKNETAASCRSSSRKALHQRRVSFSFEYVDGQRGYDSRTHRRQTIQTRSRQDFTS